MGHAYGAAQGVNDLVVLRRDLAHLGKGFDRHIPLKPAIALMGGHCFEQLDQLGTGAMLGYVQASQLIVRRYPHRPEAIDRAQQQPGQPEGPHPCDQHPFQLGNKLLTTGQPGAQRTQIGEQRNCQRAPDTAGQVHRHGTDRIINLKPKQQPVRQIHHDRTDQADKERSRRIDNMRAGGYRNHTGNHAVERVDRIDQSPAQPGHHHAAQGPGNGGQYRVGDDTRHTAIKTQRAAAVEAEPAKHQHQRAQHRQRQVRSGHAAPVPVLLKTPLARAQNQNHRQRHPAAYPVHHSRTGKIDKAAFGQPAQAIGKDAAPGPVTKQRVNEAGNDQCHQQIGRKPHPLGSGTRHDGRCRGTEHRLEQKERRMPGIGKGQHGEALAIPAAGSGPEHQTETEQPVAKNGNAQVSHVLDRNVDGIFAASQPRLQTEKADLHVEYQSGTQNQPQNIEHRDGHGRYLFHLVTGTLIAQLLRSCTPLVQRPARFAPCGSG